MYFGSEDGTVYALAPRTGANVWTYKAAGAVKAALAHSGRQALLRRLRRPVSRPSAPRTARRSGPRRGIGGSLGRGGRIYSTPAVKFGRVYVGNYDGRVYSFVANSGELAWSATTGNYVYGGPAVARVPGTKPSVYIGSYDGQLLRSRRAQRRHSWSRSYDAGGKISGAPTIIDDVVYFANLATRRRRAAYDVKDGKRVCKFGRGGSTR